MREFFKYFFGKGDTIEFENFGFSHFAPIIVAALVIFLIFKFRDKIRAFKHEKTVRLALALVMIITEMSYFWRLVGSPELKPNPVDHLPITVCGWAVIFGSYMLVTKSQSLFDIFNTFISHQTTDHRMWGTASSLRQSESPPHHRPPAVRSSSAGSCRGWQRPPP